MKLLILTLSALLLALPAVAQTENPTLIKPAYVMAGASYNQYTGAAAFLSAVIPESNSVGLFASATADIVPVASIDPKTGKTVYLLSASTRFGQHKHLFYDGVNMVLIGGDIGPTFSQAAGTQVSIGGTSIGFSGSFTATYARRLSAHWGVAVPVRMLWMSGAGPDGRGAWNPVVQAGVVYDIRGKQ